MVTAMLIYRGSRLQLDDVLVDTGSVATVFAIDRVEELGIRPEPGDRIVTLRGIGGVEAVFLRKIDRLRIGSAVISSSDIRLMQ